MSTNEALGFHLPKLPELDKEDLKAVRAFLPGKLLGRTAALLSIVLLVLGFTALADQELRRLLDVDLSPKPWLRFALLLGLPLLAVASQFLVEWRAEINRRALQRLAVRVGAEQSGYFRIGPYLSTAEDQKRFNRADRAHEYVCDWIDRSTSMPLYLTGDSGSGKSSLLNASVLPALRERGWAVVEARAWQDSEAALLDALARLPDARRPRQRERQALRDLIAATARRSGGRLLIVLDQFEEFVILGKPEQRQTFASLVCDLQAIPVKGLSLLLVLRSEYQTFLEEIGLAPLRHGENLYQIPKPAIDVVGEFENLLVESEAVAGRFRDPVADAARAGILDECRRIEPVGASVRACCAANAATLAPHNVTTIDQYFPLMTMAAILRRIDPSRSRSGRPRLAASYSPKFAFAR
jgi:hypothetical protein